MLPSGSFSARTVLITGAGTGIGRGFALRAAELGANVVLAGRRENLLQETARAIEKNGGKALICPLDIRKPDAVEAVIERVVTETGSIDVLITNAAQQKIMDTIPARRFENVDEVVEIGLFMCTPAADYINGEVLVADGGQWLNKGVFTLPEPGNRYAKV